MDRKRSSTESGKTAGWESGPRDRTAVLREQGREVCRRLFRRNEDKGTGWKAREQVLFRHPDFPIPFVHLEQRQGEGRGGRGRDKRGKWGQPGGALDCLLWVKHLKLGSSPIKVAF